jgi:hypothetical protein
MTVANLHILQEKPLQLMSKRALKELYFVCIMCGLYLVLYLIVFSSIFCKCFVHIFCFFRYDVNIFVVFSFHRPHALSFFKIIFFFFSLLFSIVSFSPFNFFL